MATATREQIAMHGHIAAALRAVMKQRGWSLPDFAEALGKPRGDTGPYKWLQATGAPGPTSRALISKVTGIPTAALQPRKPGDPPPRALVPAAAPEPPAAALRPRAVDVLTFVVDSEGKSRLKFDVSGLPVETTAPLLRILLDGGIVPKIGGEGMS